MDSGQKIRVLVIDRSHVSQRLVTMTLKNLGVFEVLACGSVEEAWDFFDAHSDIRLAITALMLPTAQDGLDMVQTIRRRYPAKKLPILMLSSNTDSELVKQAIHAGINDFLYKPVFPDVLEERIQRLLELPVSLPQLIGDYLVKKGLITDEQRSVALRYQRTYSSDHLHISVLALYLGYIEEDMLNRLFLEDAVEEDLFVRRAHILGVSPNKLAHLQELKQAHKLRMGDILVKLRFIRREVLENAMKKFYKSVE